MGKFNKTRISVKRIIVYNQNGLVKCSYELDDKGRHTNSINPKRFPICSQPQFVIKEKPKITNEITANVNTTDESSHHQRIERIDDFENIYKNFEPNNIFFGNDFRIDSTLHYDVGIDLDLNADFSNFFESLM